MKLSTKTRYGTRILFELALNYKKGIMQLYEIAKNQNISEKYSEQIISQLRSAGFVISQRGSQGGYILARDPANINLREIVEVLEGSIKLLDCLETASCDKSGRCPAQNVWKNLSDTIAETLEKVTLENMTDDYKKMNSLLNFEI